jgi:hypothetical protein
MSDDLDKKIRDAVATHNTRILRFRDAVDFLNDMSSSKDNIQRLFAYLVFFNLVEPSNVAYGVASLHARYGDLLTHICKKAPFRNVPPKDVFTIHADLPRITLWFIPYAGSIKLDIPEEFRVLRHARRNLALLYRDGPPGYYYAQGHDRFLFLMYIVCLHFTTAAKLVPDVAVSLTFFLTREMIALHETDRILRLGPNLPAFGRIDKLLRQRAPQQAAELQAQGFRSIHYAFRWQMLFFADEHDPPATLAIWDAILARKDGRDEFICQLAVEHVRQVPISGEDPALERIQKFTAWDVTKLLKDAAWNYAKVTWKTYAVLVLFAVVILLALLQGL